jgi:DNA-damage-inducible protein D
MKILPTDFEGQSIRRVFDEDLDVWWFSVIDVVQVLTESKSAKRYWSDLKRKLAQEAGSGQPYEEIVRLKLTSTDGKQRETDCAKAATLLRIVQSIPSPKAEPIKLWLAKVGYERMQEMADPALSLNRARQTWRQHGRSDKWIAQRMTGQETRNKLTDYWSEHDIKAGEEFAILTNIIHTEWSGVSVKEHKAVKGLGSAQSARPHDRSRADLHRVGRAVYTTDCRDYRRNRPGRQHHRSQSGHRQVGAQATGKPDREVRGVGPKLPGAQAHAQAKSSA